MKSNTKVKEQTKRKTNVFLKDTIVAARKQAPWHKVTELLAGPTKLHSKINLFQIDKHSEAGDTILIPGKVLAHGELTKKIKIVALSISESANEKLKESKSEFTTIFEEINKNKKFEGVKILK